MVPPAVILGLDCVTGLQAARILARRGVPVVGVAQDPRHFACRTRTCGAVIEGDPGDGAFVASLGDHFAEYSAPMFLLPCSDAAVVAVSSQRSALERAFRFVLPADAVVLGLLDKSQFVSLAEHADLVVPPTRVANGPDDLCTCAEELNFPVVVKPSVKSSEWESRVRAKAVRVGDPKGLRELAHRCAGWAGRLVVQEWVDGDDSELWSCNAYLDRAGTPLVTFVARKLRQWPPHLGTSSLGEEAPNPEVLAATLALFRETGHRGFGYVEFKHDRATGRHAVIEANVGRPTGRSAIAELGGTEFLYTAYCDALGLALPLARRQHYTGAKWIYARRDLQAAVFRWRHDGEPIRSLVRGWRGVRHDAVFAWNDQAPFWLDLERATRSYLRRAFSSVRRPPAHGARERRRGTADVTSSDAGVEAA